MYKIYSGILNARLSKWAEDNNLLSEAQNGFRPGRSCADHLVSLTSVIQSRNHYRKSTFVTFVDFSKAYDRINRDMLWSKLVTMGINPVFLSAIQSLYSGVKCCVRINGIKSRFFPVSVGLKQGCVLSPLLFNLYTSDLVKLLESTGRGISLGDITLYILLYADDIALLAESPEDMQVLLDNLCSWCDAWGLQINVDKTQLVHFRPPSVEKSNFAFSVNGQVLKVVDKYRYLGLVLTEHFDLDKSAATVAQSANRALGCIITKFKHLGGMPYETFTKLYDTLVQPVINYSAAVWGYKKIQCISAIQTRACHFYLGVGKYTPTIGVQGDMGWKFPFENIASCILKHWIRLENMDITRLNKQIFLWAKSRPQKCKNWCFYVKKLCDMVDLKNIYCDDYTDGHYTNLEIGQKLSIFYTNKWSAALSNDVSSSGTGRNKLRTYKQFKSSVYCEPYITKVRHRLHRSALAKFRLGVAPIRLETGRYEGLAENQRLCPLCENAVENEVHVLLYCHTYNDIRENLFVHLNNVILNLNDMQDIQKITVIFSHPFICKIVAKACYDILLKRKFLLYR